MKTIRLAGFIAAICFPILVHANTLSGPVSVAAGVNTRGLAVADLDKDGAMEVVVANFGSGVPIGLQPATVTASVQIFKRGPAGLALSQTLAAGNSPRGIAVADLNNDKRPDLIVTFYGENTLGVYLQNSDGSFAPAVKVPTGSQPVGVACAVLDGKPVVAVADYGSSDVTVLVADASGKLSVHPKSPLSLAPQAGAALNPTDLLFLAMAGSTRLVTANYTTNNLSVMALNSTGAGTALLVALPGTLPCKLAKGDLDGDGKEDLAVALFGNNDKNQSCVALLTQNQELFNTPLLVTLKGLHPNGIAIGDVLGMGKPAVIAADRDSDLLDVITRRDNGPWEISASLSVAAAGQQAREAFQGPVGVAVADLTGDSRADLVATYNQAAGCLKIFTQAPPSKLVLTSTSHPDPEKWYPDPNPIFRWDAPADLNGIAAYRYVLDQEPLTVPGADAASTQDTQASFQGRATGTWYFHALAVDRDGNVGEAAHLKVGITSEMNKDNVYNFPNPSRDGRTTIRFPLASSAAVSLMIYDEVGNLVWNRNLGEGDTIAGVNQVIWDGTNNRGQAAGNGGYILKVSSKDKVITKKIAIIR